MWSAHMCMCGKGRPRDKSGLVAHRLEGGGGLSLA